jgi:hypothetical protein
MSGKSGVSKGGACRCVASFRSSPPPFTLVVVPHARVAEPGRRAGLRIRCPQGRGGSTPPSRTDLTRAKEGTYDAVAIRSPPHARRGTRVGPRARRAAPGPGLHSACHDRRRRLVGQGPHRPSHLVGGTRARGLEGVAERRPRSHPARAPHSRPQRGERGERGGRPEPIIGHGPPPV